MRDVSVTGIRTSAQSHTRHGDGGGAVEQRGRQEDGDNAAQHVSHDDPVLSKPNTVSNKSRFETAGFAGGSEAHRQSAVSGQRSAVSGQRAAVRAREGSIQHPAKVNQQSHDTRRAVSLDAAHVSDPPLPKTDR
jgi:hypothetical protein